MTQEEILKVFKPQIDGGATDQFFYVLEYQRGLSITRHRGSLDTFPSDLKFNRMMGEHPVFRVG